MSQYMNLSEIEAQFPSEWILLIDPKKDAQKMLQGGNIVYHSKERDEVDNKIDELRPKNFAVIYSGPVPDDVVFAL